MDLTQPKDLLTLGAIGAVALGLLILVITLLTGRRKPARVDPEQAHLLSEMRELTDRLASELDAKSAKLERLLAEADRKIAALEKPAPKTTTIEAKPSVEAPRLRSGDSRSGEARPGDTRPNEPRGTEPLHQTIHTLADQGLSPVQIAERTSVPTGQVELILALRRTAAR